MNHEARDFIIKKLIIFKKQKSFNLFTLPKSLKRQVHNFLHVVKKKSIFGNLNNLTIAWINIGKYACLVQNKEINFREIKIEKK